VEATFFMIVGGLILAILLFNFYILPDIICEAAKKNTATTGQNVPSTLNDPIIGICSAIKK
jgi:hypothetical protein